MRRQRYLLPVLRAELRICEALRAVCGCLLRVPGIWLGYLPLRARSSRSQTPHLELGMDQNLLVSARRGPSAVALMPITDPQGTVVAFEALARYRQGRPDEVFTAAALAGERVAAELAALSAALAHVFRTGNAKLAVNVSSDTLATAQAYNLLAAHAGSLWVEVTEVAAVPPGSVAVSHLDRLAALGAVIAADDAGAGCTTPAQIRTIGANVVKLDLQLVRDQLDGACTRTQELEDILSVASSLGATVVAEGIETVAEIPAACEMGADLLQGFGIGQPVTGEPDAPGRMRSLYDAVPAGAPTA